jgi:hypothetical protein
VICSWIFSKSELEISAHSFKAGTRTGFLLCSSSSWNDEIQCFYIYCVKTFASNGFEHWYSQMFRSFQAIVFNRFEQKLRIFLTQTALFFSVLISEVISKSRNWKFPISKYRNREKIPISNALTGTIFI